MPETSHRPYRLAILNSHPIQYFAPLHRRLAAEPDIDLMVYFCSRQGSISYLDVDFGRSIQWDTSLLEGYRHRFLRNLRATDRVSGFFSLINPRIMVELYRGRYDALWVHGHNYFTFVLAIVAANLLRIPVFMRCDTHLGLHRSPAKRILRRPVLGLFYRYLVQSCLFIGSRNREFYRIYGVPASKLFSVPYTVDNSLFAWSTQNFRERSEAVKAELGVPAGTPVILYASKLTARKRPMDLLCAYERIRAARIPGALLMVGSGDQQVELKRYAAEHAVPDVFFPGFQNQSELPKYYAIADLFVLPSENEPWGLVINEAMAAALPVVATDEVGAAADLVQEGGNGFVYRSGDVDALAHILQSLVTDADLRRRMGRQSSAIIDRWNFEACVQGIHEALARSASRRDRVRPTRCNVSLSDDAR